MELFEYEFMRNAIIAAALVSVACGIIGTLVVVNRMVFISGGIAHAAYGGVGLGYFLNFSPFIGALIFSLTAAMGMGAVRLKSRERSDTVIGVMWAVGMAIGIVLVDLTPGYKADLMSYLFGSLLTVPPMDLVLMIILNVVIILTVFLLYKEIMAISFDEAFAKVENIPTTTIYLLILVLTAFSVVMLMRVVGLLMVIALLTIPPAIAGRWVKKLSNLMVTSTLVGLVFSMAGLVVSYQFDISSGASIILVAGAGYFLNLAVPRQWVSGQR